MLSRTLSITVERPVRTVYEFIRDLANLPLWARSFCQQIQRYDDDFWLMVTPLGPMKIKMTPKNDFGILDHLVIPDPILEIHVPMRVIYNDESASDVMITLIGRPGMTRGRFEQDAAMMEQDLLTLKTVLEKTVQQ